MTMRPWVVVPVLLALGLGGCGGPAPPAGRDVPFASGDTVTIPLFHDNIIHFTPEDSSRYDTVQVWHTDNGRVLNTYRELRLPDRPVRILARVATRPIPKDVQSVHDPWDRAGYVGLARPGMPEVEIIKFVTAYGGVTEHLVDVTHLAPLLDGTVAFRGFVDTWSSPGWEMDFELRVVPDPAAGPPAWAQGILNEQEVTADLLREGPLRATLEIPEGTGRVILHYLVSGHCTDGRDADEFVTKDNVLRVDGIEVQRFRPWRDDCRRFREINPYCRRWSDGTWSSDFSRSGWCPGDAVLPLTFDLTRVLPPGRHVLELDIEDIRPRDADGNFGYWRVSMLAAGWEERP